MVVLFQGMTENEVNEGTQICTRWCLPRILLRKEGFSQKSGYLTSIRLELCSDNFIC